MTNSLIRLSIALAVGLLLVGAARGDYMDWSYHWSISPAPVLTSGSGLVAQALGSSGTGARRILAAAVTTSSDSTEVAHFNSNFALTLHVSDWLSHKSGSLSFSGNISGTLAYDSAHLTETFRYPIEHLRLGNHMYWVELPSHLRLMSPGSLVVPTFYAMVWVENLPPPPVIHPGIRTSSLTTASIVAGPHVSSTPEPSGLALSGLGVVLLSCVFVRRTWG
jgi:hypothetical protein